MVKVAVLGLGYMGQNHVRILSSLRSVKLVAICDVDKAKSDRIAENFKVKSYSHFQELIKSENLDAIFICLPTMLHYKSAKLTLEKGIAVFIEKPISANVKQAEHLIAFSKRKKIPMMIGHIERFNPVVREIKRRLASGELGKVLYIHTQRFSPPPTRAQDVSAIVDLATHDVDIILYLLNEEPRRIYAETETSYHKKEDLMSALLRFKSGIIGLVEVSWLHPNKIRTLSVMGENGMYMANYVTQELSFYRQSEKIMKKDTIHTPDQNWADVIKIAFEAKEPLQIELEAFIDSLEQKSKMPVTAEEGLAALKLTQKFSQSGKNHRITK